MEEEKGIKIDDLFEVNPVLLKSAAAEDDTMFSSPIDTKEYKRLQDLCKESRSKDINPYNIALIGNYGTGKSKIALNLLHEFEERGAGFYTEISGVTAGQIITNIYRDVHEKLFGLRRLVYQAVSKGVKGGLYDVLGISKYKIEIAEGTKYLIPEDHLENINKILNLYLFSWDNVPGNDSERLLRYIRDDFDIGWAENAEIRKADYGKTIRIFKDKNSAEIMIDEKKEKATLKISDGRTHDLKVKKENGKLNIYVNLMDLKKAFEIAREIHKNFMEAFAGIAEFSEKFGSLEIILPEEKVTTLTSSEKAAQHLGTILNSLNTPVLFILDELEKIYKLDQRERVKFLDFIRAFIDINNKFVFIFCFTRFSFDSLIKQHAALYSRIPVIISLKNFNRAQFDQFMANRFKQGLKEGYILDSIFEKSFFDFLWELTAGNQRSSLFILDRFIEYSKLNEYEPPYGQGDLITFLELQPDTKDQLLDMLLYDVKERAQTDPKMSVILDILVKDYGGGPITLTELSSDERCVYDQEALKKIIIEMQENDIIKVAKINDDMHFIVNMIIPEILSKTKWFDKKKEVFDP